MSTNDISAVRPNMDTGITMTSRPTTAPEFQAIDRRVGGLPVNAWTYRLLRIAGGLIGPKADTRGVTITTEPGVKRGTIVVRPDTVRGTGALFLIHGGGFVLGAPDQMIATAAGFARDVGVPVFLPSYRLAPQHPFPAALDDCHAGWGWLQKNAARFGVEPTRIVVGGWSAGGGHAAALAQRLLDEGGSQPIAQLLVYPMLDDRTAADRSRDTPAHRVWSNANNRFGWESYLGHPPGGPAPRYAVPARREDLTGLPPAWVGVGTPDLFLHEDRAYVNRLREAGVDCTYVEVDGCIHGFDALVMDAPLSKAFLDSMIAFVTPHVR